MIEQLFNYRPGGKTITTNAGEETLMVIRKGPRGIVAVIKLKGPVVIYGADDAESHKNDSEESLTTKLIEVLNA